MKELENLLNKLIEKGWKPFELDWITNAVYDCWKIVFRQKGKHSFSYSIREMVSLESGLWQFICDNKLYNRTYNFRENVRKTWYNIWWFSHNFQYWVLESALMSEEDLLKFLIDNIKI